MRANAGAAAAVVCALAAPARSESLPPGSIGLILGGISGTGADAKRLGAGVQYGAQASWQPMSSDHSVGWALRWATMFGRNYGGTAAQVDSKLSTLQMDLTIGVRYRPWVTPRRYHTLRAGTELLRTNEPIPTSNDAGAEMRRAFLGGVASVGLDQYLWSFAMLSVDVRYGTIGGGPSQIALVVGIGVVGP
jgi:hypothetical protein